MSDLRQTLNQVLAGSEPPAKFLSAVDEYLAKPDANVAALRSLIDAAEHLGLPAEVATAARARLPGADGVQAIGEPTRVADSDDTTEVMTPEATKVDIGEPTRVVEDEDATTVMSDEERTVLTTGQAATQLRANPADVDPDRTVITGDADDDATVQVGGGDDDPFAMSAPGAGAKGGDELGPGSVLKGRFRLEQVIGQGGMGAVYKAVDLLKVEARDRNPYIAVKLLVGDFKEHPEAFIALQRESAKAQRLAHPNIATVYDFDRDGETVYMTMEMMVGAELAQYIKKLPAGGLPVPEALRILEQLCAGLQYAHARGLVHSDFKPGNAFLLDDGSVKLLDFGIARASSTKADAEGESTVFDPGQLGALTPAYATLEMFEGQDPDPRDDIYALACVAYELFTGKHPFNKMSAVKAKEKNLKPAPVEKLTKRQNRTLLHALALHRADRLGSVEEFWEGIKARKDYTLQIAAGATAGVLLLGALLYNPVMNLIHEREYAAIITEIDSGDETRLVAALAQIDALPPERRAVVTERAQDAIVAYFRNRAEAEIDESQGQYDYPAAFAEITELETYFPDSRQVGEYRDEVTRRRDDEALDLGERFEAVLAAGALMPDESADDLAEVTAILQKVKPEDPLLTDVRVTNAYADLANAAVRQENWQRANEVLQTALAYSGSDRALLDLNDRVSTELRRQQDAALVAQLEGTLRQARPRSIEEFRAVRESLQRLGELRPDNQVVRGLDAPLVTAVAGGIDAATAAGDWAAADALLAEFARVLPLDAVIEQRTELSAAQQAAGFTPDAARIADVQQRIDALRASLQGAAFDEAFERELMGGFKEVTARLTADTEGWDALRSDIAQAYIGQSQQMMAENRFSSATAMLEHGEVFQPSMAAFETERTALAAAERAYVAEQERLERVAAIEAAKRTMLSEAQANRISARESFDALARQLPANDPFITTEGPEALVGMYSRMAQSAAGNDQYANAVDFVEAGLQVLPDSQQLRDLLTQYQARAARAAVVTAASRLAQAGVAAFERDYRAQREGLSGADATNFERDVVSALVGRLNTLDESRQGASVRAEIIDLFAGAQRQRLTSLNLREPLQPSTYAPRITALIGERKLTEARQLLGEANRAEPDHPELAGFPAELTRLERQANDLYSQARQQAAANNSSGAITLITQAQRIWVDNADFAEFARQNKGTAGAVRQNDGSTPCKTDFAGYGKRVNGRCNDVVENRVPAPQLVVIEGVAGGAPFAISRYEVSVQDYNRFCAATGCAQLPGDAALPATGLSVQNADAYIAWLSQVTGQTYRLPTDAEWLHAAGGGGDAGASSQYNCTVMSGGTAIKGGNLANVTAGQHNGWGVVNAVGNAQEWVRAGGSLQVRGGAHTDPLTDCSINLVRPHSGAADAVTGFRVARDVE